MSFIALRTGVRLAIRPGDMPGYMDIVLFAGDEDSMEHAVSMCEDLVGTVLDEFDDEEEEQFDGPRARLLWGGPLAGHARGLRGHPAPAPGGMRGRYRPR